MLAQLLETWALATVRDIALTVLGLVALGSVLALLGKRRALRNLTEEHFYVTGVVVVIAGLVAIGLYNRYLRG